MTVMKQARRQVAIAGSGVMVAALAVLLTTGPVETQSEVPLYSDPITPELLGTCSAEIHDRYIVDGGDGFRYRTWHPRTTDGCAFGHEHGDDPSTQTNEKVRSVPIRFGYVGRRMPSTTEPNGHVEPHGGFKVAVANKGKKNHEGRISLHDARMVVHMGTGGAKRFTTPHHSVQFVTQTSQGYWMNYNMMADTGGVGNICAAPRQGKTVMVIDPRCKVDSLYEIWEMKSELINLAGRMVGRAVVSFAVFDPITAYDPKQPDQTVLIGDPAVNVALNWPNWDRSDARGCDREAYHGPLVWDNGGGKDVYVTNPMGKEVASAGALTLTQEMSKTRFAGNFLFTSDQTQFKLKQKWCGQGLSTKN